MVLITVLLREKLWEESDLDLCFAKSSPALARYGWAPGAAYIQSVGSEMLSKC